jgi:sodium/proline symporter
MTLQYIVLILYFGALGGIGYFASRRVRNLDDYFVGGKGLGYWVVAFSARATGESAWLLLGLTGLGAMVGVSAFWVVVGEVLGVAVGWFFMAKPFKRETDRLNSITVPDYLVSRFASDEAPNGVARARLLRMLSAGALAVFVTIYVSAQIDATGKAFESFLHWDYYIGILVGFGVVVLYTFAGGFIAVAWSDLFQGGLMLVGLVALPIMALLSLPTGQGLLGGLADIDPGLIDVMGAGGFTATNITVLISYLAIGIGFLGSPQVFVRFMAIQNEADIDRGRWVAVGFTFLTDAGAVLTGMAGRYLLTGPGAGTGPGSRTGAGPGTIGDVEAILGTAAENVLPLLVEHVFPPLVVGLYIAAVLAAIMSTIDSLLLVGSSAVVRDFYQQLYHPDLPNDKLTSRSRTVTLVMAIVALGIALLVSFLSPDRTVFWFVIFGWSGIAATFCPAIILSLFWKGFTYRGVIASMVTGFICVPGIRFGVTALPVIGEYAALLGEMAPSVLLALIAGVVFSESTKSPDKAD